MTPLRGLSRLCWLCLYREFVIKTVESCEVVYSLTLDCPTQLLLLELQTGDKQKFVANGNTKGGGHWTGDDVNQ